MLLDPNFKSFTTKVLEAMGLEKEFKDRYRTEHGTVVIEHLKSKKEIEILEAHLSEIRKHRGALQKLLLDKLKNVILSYDFSDSTPSSSV